MLNVQFYESIGLECWRDFFVVCVIPSFGIGTMLPLLLFFSFFFFMLLAAFGI